VTPTGPSGVWGLGAGAAVGGDTSGPCGLGSGAAGGGDPPGVCGGGLGSVSEGGFGDMGVVGAVGDGGGGVDVGVLRVEVMLRSFLRLELIRPMSMSSMAPPSWCPPLKMYGM
jgi:hypothetical protein